MLLSLLHIQTATPKITHIFDTLDQIKKYAQTHPEYPDIDNKDWANPDYTSFYKKNLPSRLDRVLRFIRIKSKPLWNTQTFEALLKKVTRFRENNGYMGRFVQRIEPEPGAKFIVWGDLFGAFHSIDRCLQYLKKKKIIDNNLRITDKNTYFVFKGNVIDLSPYILETLTVVLKLMEINPENVIYIRGLHEEKETWLQFGLKTELEIKAADISDEKTPLKKLINRFFQTLPLAVFITRQSNDQQQAIRLSYAGMEYGELATKNFPQLFQDDDIEQKVKIFNLQNSQPGNPKVTIETIIKSPHKKPIPPQGLTLEEKDKDANSFSLFSSPSKTFRALHKFFYDSFAVISIKEQFKDWTITLYNQDVREMLGIHKVETYNLLTGDIVSKVYLKLQKQVKKLEDQLKKYQTKTKKSPIPKRKQKPKVTPVEPVKKKIKIGSTVDTTGTFATIGKSIKKGLIPFMETAELILLEDDGKPQNITLNIKKLIEKEKTNIILSPLVMGAPHVLQKFSKEALFLFPNPPYKDSTKNIINFGPTIDEIAHFSLKYAIENEKTTKFAFFYHEALFKQAVQSVVKNLEKSTYLTVPYDERVIKLENKAAKIRKFRPAALFLWVPPSTAKKIIKQIGPINLTDTIIIGYQLGTPKFKRFLEKVQLIRQYVGIETIPNPHKSNIEIMKTYRSAMNQTDIDIFSAQAYICASIYEGMTKQIEGQFTKENIISIAENTKNQTFKGLTLHFNPDNRSLYNYLWVDTGKDKWKRFEIEKPKPKATVAGKPSKSIRKKEIVFGTTMDLRGHLRGASKKTRFAIKRLFDLENKKGGINGRTLKLVSENDDYKPKIAKANVEKMFKDKNIDIILNPIGGPTTQTYVDMVEKGEILVLFPSTGAPALRDPKLKYMIHFRPSYESIHVAAIKYVKEKENAKKFAFVFQEGAASGESVKLAIEKNNISKADYIEIPYSRGQVSFEDQAKKILDFEPDVIAFWCQSVVLSKIVEKVGTPNLKNKILLTTEMGSIAALKYMKKIGLLDNFMNTENIPSPAKSELEIMKAYREDLKAPDNFLAETYISTKYLIEILKKLQNPTKEKIIEAMENTKNYDLGGFKLNFDPQTRQLSNQIWIYKAGREIGKISTEI